MPYKDSEKQKAANKIAASKLRQRKKTEAEKLKLENDVSKILIDKIKSGPTKTCFF